jgi:hypothetical protein
MLRYEAALGLGTTNIYGDLGGAPNAKNLLFIQDITFRSTRPSIYAALRYKVDPRASIKLNLIYGFSNTKDFSGSRNEHREFKSFTDLFETSVQYEFYFLQEERRLKSAAMFNRRGMVNNYSTIGAYVFAGAGATLFWPELELEALRPTDTYKSGTQVTLSLPIGAGVKYILSDQWILGWELGYRHTLSDFLDGVQPAASNNRDVYWISTLNLSYRIPTSRRGIPIFMDKQWRRARF